MCSTTNIGTTLLVCCERSSAFLRRIFEFFFSCFLTSRSISRLATYYSCSPNPTAPGAPSGVIAPCPGRMRCTCFYEGFPAFMAVSLCTSNLLLSMLLPWTTVHPLTVRVLSLLRSVLASTYTTRMRGSTGGRQPAPVKPPLVYHVILYYSPIKGLPGRCDMVLCYSPTKACELLRYDVMYDRPRYDILRYVVTTLWKASSTTK